MPHWCNKAINAPPPNFINVFGGVKIVKLQIKPKIEISLLLSQPVSFHDM